MKELEADRELMPEELRRVAALSEHQLSIIDAALRANTAAQWRKVARVVGDTMSQPQMDALSLPDVCYASRVKDMVACGLLEAQGNLECMRLSEVRIAQQALAANAWKRSRG